MLAMAQKLHDDYVQAGEAERDRIIGEAHSAADQIRERAERTPSTAWTSSPASVRTSRGASTTFAGLSATTALASSVPREPAW